MSRNIVVAVKSFCSSIFEGDSVSLGDGLSLHTYGIRKGFVTLNVTNVFETLWSMRIRLSDVRKLFQMLLTENIHMTSVVFYDDTYLWSAKEENSIFLRIENVSQRKDMYLTREDVLQAHQRYLEIISDLKTDYYR